MLGPSFVRRTFPGLVLSASLLGITGIASASMSQDRAADPTEQASDDQESSGGWGPIVGACFGVLFGGVLAVWQIRGMKNRS